MTLNVCQAGHLTHESKQVETEFGPWWIWDWERYAGFAGYCTGQDEVSKSIEITGWWEKPDTDRMLSILTEKPGVVLDFGAHIGWFSVLALERDCSVLAVDADPENVRLWYENVTARGEWLTKHGALRYGMVTSWVAEFSPNLISSKSIRFLKADVEGHEYEVINLTRHLWQDRLIDYALLEISPIFENRDTIMAPSYAQLVDELIGYGYDAYILKDEENWHITGEDVTFPQENVWFSKI